MKHLIALTILTIGTFWTQVYSQDNKISYYEKFIIEGVDPYEDGVQTRYQNDYRVLVWNDELTKDYKYNNEAFDKLGYEYVKTNKGDHSQISTVYRNCDKGIICTVTKWYGLKLSISIEWYDESVRRSIGYLMFCE